LTDFYSTLSHYYDLDNASLTEDLDLYLDLLAEAPTGRCSTSAAAPAA
jgi:hypothetical protein